MKTNKYDGSGNVIPNKLTLAQFLEVKIKAFGSRLKVKIKNIAKELFWSAVYGVGVFVFLAIICSIAAYIFGLSDQQKNAEVVVGQLKIPALWILCIAIGWCINLKVLTNKGEL